MNLSHRSRQILAAISLIGPCVSGYAQGVDAGSLMRQTEQSYRANNAARMQSKLISIEPPLVLTSDESIKVKNFRFLGAKLINLKQLEVASSPYADRDLHQSDLDNLCSTVADAYRQAGWIVRVYVPRQPLNSETLTLQVLETVQSPPK